MVCKQWDRQRWSRHTLQVNTCQDPCAQLCCEEFQVRLDTYLRPENKLCALHLDTVLPWLY